MIAISTTTFDLDGARVLDVQRKTQIPGIARRVSRTGTLDGDAAFYDGGFTHADRTLEIVQDPHTAADLEFCQYIAQSYAEVIVSTSFGVFSGVPSTVKTDATKLTMTILIKEKLDE